MHINTLYVWKANLITMQNHPNALLGRMHINRHPENAATDWFH